MQSIMFCEAYCSDHITKWENVLETIMKDISVGLCSPQCFAKLFVPTTSGSGKMFWKALMNNFSVGLCSPKCFEKLIVPITSPSGKMI